MNKIKEQLPFTLDKFDAPDLGKHYQGKVRENFHMDDEILMVTTDRVSAFDHVLGTIPRIQKKTVLSSVDKAANTLICALAEGFDSAMDNYN